MSFIKEQLHCLGFGYIWNDQNCINIHVCLPIIKQGLKDHFIQNLQSKIQCESKCYMYKHFWQLLFTILHRKTHQNYIKNCITKKRVSSHYLCIESGRHRNITRDKTFCKTCTSTIVDEYHFIRVCPVYKELRSKCLKKYYWGKPSMLKLIRLLSVYNVKELCNLGKTL